MHANAPLCGGADIDAMPIRWQNLRAELLRPQHRVLLDDACGCAMSGRLLAVLGPSGAGKTTFLQSLAGRLERTKKVCLSGTIEGLPENGAAPVSFIYQDDVFHSRLSVEETLLFAAAMRLPGDAIESRVSEVLLLTGLQDVAASVVGNTKVRGVSGGERKRLAIGCELLVDTHSPLFADEPTSGLDSFQALRIIEALRAAALHRVVMLSVHQPSSRLLENFDDALLLGAGGRTLYIGSTLEMQRSVESQQNISIGVQPSMYSTAEWMLELASIDPKALEDSSRRVSSLADAWREKQQCLQIPFSQPNATTMTMHSASCFLQLRWCIWRAWRQSTASMGLLAMRAVGSFITGVVFGGIFWQLQLDDVKGRIGLLNVLCNYFAMTVALRSVRVLQDGEAVVVQRERASGVLRLAPYFLGKILVDLPLNFVMTTILIVVVRGTTALQAPLPSLALVYFSQTVACGAFGLAAGALAPSLDIGLELSKAVMTLFIVFGGVFFDVETLPWFLRWVTRVSIIHITWDGALVAESAAIAELPGGASVAATLQADQARPFKSVVFELLCTGFALYILAFLTLVAKAPRFQRIVQLHDSPRDDSTVEFREERHT